MSHLRKPVQVDQIPQENSSPKDTNRPKIQCWVPGCSSTSDQFPAKTFYSLPEDPLLKDFWLAAAGKKYYLPLQNIWFCENHFLMDKETKEPAFPVCKMPQKMCRTCLATIQDQKYCILSSNINSKMPEPVEQIFGCATVVPLIEVLQFCIPEMPIEMNPVPISCDNCYRNIWIYYFFKKKCMYKDKAIQEEFYPGKYGNLVGCRACPSTDYTNLVSLYENSELGILLNSMFSNSYSSSIISLKLCPACISVLKGVQEFRRVFSRAQEYFKRLCKDPPRIQAIPDKPTVVAVNEKDTVQKQLLLGKLMLEKGLDLKDRNVSEIHQANIWNTIQKGSMRYGCHYSIQNLKDTWSMIILEYTLGRLKGTELGDILSQYMRDESPKLVCKPLKKRYREPSSDSGFDSSNTQAAEQNVTVEQNIIPYRINTEPVEVFEPNIITPPSCSTTTSLPPPYVMSNAYQSDANTVTCSPVVEPDTAVNLTAENHASAQGYQASYNVFLSNIGAAKLAEQLKKASTKRVASNLAQNSNLKQTIESRIQNKCPEASFMSTSACSLSKTESAKVPENESSLNPVTHFGTGQSIPLMPMATTSFYSSGTTAPGIKTVKCQWSNTGRAVLDRNNSDPSEYPCKVEQNVGNSCIATSIISVIKSAIPDAGNVIDLTEDEDKMVQVANISSSWEEQLPKDTAGNAESQLSNDIEMTEISTDNARTRAVEVSRLTDTVSTRGVVVEGDQIDKVGVGSEASTSKARKTNHTCPVQQTATKRNASFGSRKQRWLNEDKLEFIWTIKKHFLATHPSHFRGWHSFLETAWKNSEIKNKISPECMYSRWRKIYIDFRNGHCDPNLADAVFEFVQMLESYAIKMPKFLSNDTVRNLTISHDKKNDMAMEEASKFNDADPLISSDIVVKGKQNVPNTEVENTELRLTKFESSCSDVSAQNLNSTNQIRHNKEKLEFVASLQEHFLASNPKNFKGRLPFMKAACGIVTICHELNNTDVVSIKKIPEKNNTDRTQIASSVSDEENAPRNPPKKVEAEKGMVKSHQCFSFQDKVDLIDTMKYEYEVSRNKGVLPANPWRTMISKLHQEMYDNWDENRLWRMWCQMRLSAKIHAKDGSDYVDTEVWNLLEKHNNYLKDRKKMQQSLGSTLSCPPEKESDNQHNLKEKLEKQDDKLPVACGSIDSPSKKVQTLISSYCTVEKKIDSPTKAHSSSTCASVVEQTDHKPSDAKEYVKLEKKPSQAKMDILTIEIDSDSDFSDGNNDSRLIKLLHTIKEAKRTSKLTSAKTAEKLDDKHDSELKNTGRIKPAVPDKKKRKKRPLTLARVKKDKKPKLALPPLDPNRLEEDKEDAERTIWSEKEQNDLINIIESTGNEVFKPDIPKQFWNNVRTKLIEKGHSERSVGALYYKWNRLLESAKMAWADQKAMNDFDKAVISFLTGVIRNNVKKPYSTEENEETKDATKSNVSGEIITDKQQSELHSVDQNKSGREVICDTSSSTNENNEKCIKEREKCIKENTQENNESEYEENETEDDASESEDDYVSAADIMKM